MFTSIITAIVCLLLAALVVYCCVRLQSKSPYILGTAIVGSFPIFLCILFASLHVSWALQKCSGELFITNLTPFAMRCSIQSPGAIYSGSESIWESIAAGETRAIHRSFWRRTPSFQICAVTADKALTTFALQQDYIVLADREKALRQSPPGIFDNDPTSTLQVSYHRSEESPPGSGVHRFVLSMDSIDGELSVNEECRRATMALLGNTSLRRQLEFDTKWRGQPTFPFHLGVEFDVDDSVVEPGVAIAAVTHSIMDGKYPSPFQDGDILMSFSGKPVYGYRDILALLHEHATDVKRGIEIPIAFEIFRRDKFGQRQMIAAKTSYFFDQKHFDSRGVNIGPEYAFTVNFFDAALLGYGAESIALLSSGPYNVDAWSLEQRQAMAAQWHPEASRNGTIPAMLANLPHRFVGSLGNPRLVRFAGSRFGSLGLNILEEVAYDAETASSIRDVEQYYADMKGRVPWVLGGSVVEGLLSR